MPASPATILNGNVLFFSELKEQPLVPGVRVKRSAGHKSDIVLFDIPRPSGSEEETATIRVLGPTHFSRFSGVQRMTSSRRNPSPSSAASIRRNPSGALRAASPSEGKGGAMIFRIIGSGTVVV